ncbi:MAG TPA: amidohydrolase family protein, partial [Candidatus Binatia bacterium]
MMRVDIHSHTAPAKYLEAIRRDPKSMGSRIEKNDQGHEAIVQENGRSTRVRTNLIDPELRLREMAAERVDVIVESLLPPLLPLWAPIAIGVRVCQVVNDAIAEDAARYPGRIVGMGIVPMQDVGEAIRELDRLVKQHHMPSVLIPASHAGRILDEPEFFSFFERAQEYGVLIFIHPHEVAA